MVVQGRGSDSGCPFLAMNGGSGHRLATPELPSATDIRDRTSAFSDFRRLYLQHQTWQASPENVAVDPFETSSGVRWRPDCCGLEPAVPTRPILAL